MQNIHRHICETLLLTVENHSSTHRSILWHKTDSESRSYSYAQLAVATKQLRDDVLADTAAAAADSSASSPHFVGVLLGHEPTIVPALLGIISVQHAAFVCIDPEAKAATLFANLDAFNITIIVAGTSCKKDARFLNRFHQERIVPVLDTTLYIVHLHAHETPQQRPISFRLPILFGVWTSGSTGAPKALAVPTQCFVPNIQKLEQMYVITSTDLVYLSAPPTFDPFVLDLIIGIRAGATIVLVASAALRLSAQRLIPVLFPPPNHTSRLNSITVMPLTPSLLQRFTDRLLRDVVLNPNRTTLRLLLIGGESCPSTAKLRCWLPDLAFSPELRIVYMYGLTEMSCWSMTYELQLPIQEIGDTSFPLGDLLDSDGEWSLYDRDKDCRLDKKPGNEGELILHSVNRFTYRLSDSTSSADEIEQCGSLNTGDIVRIDCNGELLYSCRADQQIKRLGTRVSGTSIEEFCRKQSANIAGISAVSAGFIRCMWLNDTGTLVLFVHIDDAKAASKIRNDLLQRMRSELPANSVPDEVYCIAADWPITKHGKFDWRTALLIGQQRWRSVAQNLADMFVEYLTNRFSLDASLSSWLDLSFGQLGGTSFEALYLMNHLFATSDGGGAMQMPDLMGMLLNSDCTTRVIVARLRQNDDQKHESAKSKFIPNPQPPTAAASIRWSVNMNKCVDATPTILSYGRQEFVAIGSHSHLLLTLRAADGFIQSKLQLNDRIEGAVCQLNDQEHGHDSSSSSSIAVVGCYDGCLYAFDFMTGERIWTLSTGGGMIKTRPLWLQHLDWLVIGTYMQQVDASFNIWCVNAETGTPTWKLRLGEKSICASPIIMMEKSNCKVACNCDIVICTLDGTCARLTARQGEIVWRKQFDSPIFATPLAIQFPDSECRTVIIVCDVMGIVRCINANDGLNKWSCRAAGNIFSAPVLLHRESVVVFGCQDAGVYGIGVYDGTLRWRSDMDAAVYATPLRLKQQSGKMDTTTVVACSTTGELVWLDGESGLRRWVRRVSGEVFSSPVELRDGAILIGSRDDWVYCVDDTIGKLSGNDESND